MPTAIYPGTFDPVTFGHIDIAVRASKIFKRVIAIVADNPGKNPLFSVEERMEMIKEALRHVPNIEVATHSGLVVNCVRKYKSAAIIRGLRAMSDLDYEFQMAFTNRNLLESAETVFFMPSAEYSYLNSSMVKQIVSYGAGSEVCSFVPEFVHKRLLEKLKDKK